MPFFCAIEHDAINIRILKIATEGIVPIADQKNFAAAGHWLQLLHDVDQREIDAGGSAAGPEGDADLCSDGFMIRAERSGRQRRTVASVENTDAGRVRLRLDEFAEFVEARADVDAVVDQDREMEFILREPCAGFQAVTSSRWFFKWTITSSLPSGGGAVKLGPRTVTTDVTGTVEAEPSGSANVECATKSASDRNAKNTEPASNLVLIVVCVHVLGLY